MELYLTLTILDRDKARRMQEICRESGSGHCVTTLGRGTATPRMLDRHGLESTEKALVLATADAQNLRKLRREIRFKLRVDVPGNGIFLAVPLKSVAGQDTYRYLSADAPMEKGSPNMDFTHELIVIIANQGYTDDVMEAARSAGASGGTVVHARGTGGEYARKFLGLTLADEKEIILVVSGSGEKGQIMQTVSEKAGVTTPAGAICFSLPVSSVMGLRSAEED